MANDFSANAGEISATLDRLIQELSAVEGAVGTVSRSFSQFADQASRVDELNTSVSTLRDVLDRLDAPFLERIAQSTQSLNDSLNNINPRGLLQINDAYSQQIYQLERIVELQNQIRSQQATPTNNQELLASLLQGPGYGRSGLDLQESLKRISKGYGQVNYASSQVGAVINAAALGVKGINQGGVGGFIDVAEAGLKGVSSLANLSQVMRNATGVGFLPQGVGNVFTQPRSHTILDLIEILTGITTGMRRQGSLDPESGEFDTPTLEEAKKKIKQAKNSGVSTGKQQRENKKSNLDASDIEELVRNEIDQFLTENERQLSDVANTTLKQYLGSSKGSQYSNLFVAGAASFSKFGQATPEDAGGFNDYYNGTAYQAVLNDAASAGKLGQNKGFVALHELSHAATDNTPLINPTQDQFNTEQEYQQMLNENRKITQLARDRAYTLSQSPLARADIKRTGVDTDFADIAKFLSQTDTIGYKIGQPKEAYANIGATLLANQEDLTKIVTKAYGPDLFNAIKNNLQQYQPEVFGEEVIKKIGDEYKNFNAQLNKLALEGDASPTTPEQAQAEQTKLTFKQRIQRKIQQQKDVAAQQAQAAQEQDVTETAQQTQSSLATTVIEHLRQVFSNLKNIFPEGIVDTVQQHVESFINFAAETLAELGKIQQPGLQTLRAGLEPERSGLSPQQAAQGVQTGVNAATQTAQDISQKVLDYATQVAGKLNYQALGANVMNQLFGTSLGPILTDAMQGININQISAQIQSGGNISNVKTQIQQVFNQTLDSFLQQSFSTLVVDPTRPSLGKFLAENVPGAWQSSTARGILNQFTDPNSLAGKLGIQSNLQQAAAYQIGRQFNVAPPEDYFNQVNQQFIAKAGSTLDKSTYNQQTVYDFNEGITRVAVSAKTAEGAMVNLNAKVNQFNELSLETAKQNPVSGFLTQFFIEVPRQIANELTYGVISQVQELLKSIINVQGELTEVQAIFEQIGGTQKQAEAATSDFLYKSIEVANQTAQPLTL